MTNSPFSKTRRQSDRADLFATFVCGFCALASACMYIWCVHSQSYFGAAVNFICIFVNINTWFRHIRRAKAFNDRMNKIEDDLAKDLASWSPMSGVGN